MALNASAIIRHVHQPGLAEGILGFRWRSSRSAAYERLPQSAKDEIGDLGSRFFTAVNALIETEPVRLHFQFADGLTGITIAPLKPLMLSQDLLTLLTRLPAQDELEHYLGPPVKSHDASPYFQVAEWHTLPVIVALMSNRRGEMSLTYRVQATTDARASLVWRAVELEDIVPSPTVIQHLIDHDDAAAAGKLDWTRRLGLGWCPHCGSVIGSWHLPACPHLPKENPCRLCRTRAMELGEMCLLCAQGMYIRRKLEVSPTAVLEKERVADDLIRLNWQVDGILQTRPWFVEALDGAHEWLSKRTIPQLVLWVFILLAVLRIVCGA